MADRLIQKKEHVKGLIKDASDGHILSKNDLEREIGSLWEWILFFQHERLIHLLVTILFALLTFGSLVTYLVTGFLPVIALFVLFLALLIPYIFHYYHLENGVQQLYDLYDQLKASKEDKQNG